MLIAALVWVWLMGCVFGAALTLYLFRKFFDGL